MCTPRRSAKPLLENALRGNIYLTLIASNLSSKRECGAKRVTTGKKKSKRLGNTSSTCNNRDVMAISNATNLTTASLDRTDFTTALQIFNRCDTSLYQNQDQTLPTGWFTLKNPNVFHGECPRRFVDSNRGILHTSSMCRCEDLTLSGFFFLIFRQQSFSENVNHLSPNIFGEKKSKRKSDLGLGM